MCISSILDVHRDTLKQKQILNERRACMALMPQELLPPLARIRFFFCTCGKSPKLSCTNPEQIDDYKDKGRHLSQRHGNTPTKYS